MAVTNFVVAIFYDRFCLSEREGISLNQFVNNSLAFVVGQKLAH